MKSGRTFGYAEEKPHFVLLFRDSIEHYEEGYTKGDVLQECVEGIA